MPCLRQLRALTATLFFGLAAGVLAQDPSTVPVTTPAGVSSQRSEVKISEKQAREADDAYIEGAKHIQHGDLVAAEHSFARAVQLNPNNRDYVFALADVREHRVTGLVQEAAHARSLGQNDKADDLLAQARLLDPDNPVVAQHFSNNAVQSNPDPFSIPAADIASVLGGPIDFAPTPGLKDIHLRGNPRDVLRDTYAAYGISVTFDDSFTNSTPLRVDLEQVDFATATRIVGRMTHVFAVPLQPKSGLVAKDNQEQRDRLIPQLEETVYLPGVPQDEMAELANVARNIFDLQKVTASATAGDMVIRGDEPSLKLVNATFADLLDGGSDVELDINLYEINRTHQVDIGAQLPASASIFSVEQEAQNLVNANQSTVNAILQSGQVTLPTGISNEELILLEALALIKYAGVTDANITNLLGLVGTLDGVPLAGLAVSGTSTFNLLLNSSDVRMLDAVTLRGASGQELDFRAGSRYPVVTSTYSSGISSSLASQLSGININGTSAASLLAQLGGGASSASIPTFQFEDLGITLKTKPQVLHTGSVSLTLDMKIEALAGGVLNSIPILNSRTLTSTINVAAGQSALLASNLSSTELLALDGLPGLSELPGFQGTDKNKETSHGELLITITPHIIRTGSLRIASRPLPTPPIGPPSQ